MFGSTSQPADHQLPNGPSEAISSINWSPKANHIVASSWDNTLRCWDVHPNSGNLLLQTQLEAPLLSTAWHDDGSKVFCGGCDNKGFIWDLQANKTTQVAQHEKPIKDMAWIPLQGGLLMTASWDKTVKYWDTRQANPVFSVTLNERVYCMDVRQSMCVIGTADRNISIYNLGNPAQPYKVIESPLKLQTRCVSVFTDQSGFAVGSIEGRVGIQYLEETATQKHFAFKCHRDKSDVFAVNAISFHPQYGTFATAGSDGTFHFWDKDSKQRLKQFNKLTNNGPPVTACKFNATGNLFAYAVGYDWSKGHEGYQQYVGQTQLRIHVVDENEIKARKTVSTTKKK